MRRGFTPLEITAHPLSYTMSNKKDKACYTNITFDGRKRQRRFLSLTGFTLIELLFTFGILAFSLSGILLTHINMFILSDLSGDLTLATNAIQAKAEEIKRTNFDNLLALNGTTFDINGFAGADAKGAVEITDIAYSDLKRARITAYFKSRGRVIGEDDNLNGSLDIGEDDNGNGRLDSPAELVTLIAR